MKNEQDEESFPKIIWFLWLQGLPSAPAIVQKCFESWVTNNKNWKIVLLDKNNIVEYISLPNAETTPQALSDIIRINLLAEHGGIWVDATCYCTTPLDNWIYDHIKAGFFAFDRPGPDRMISSWFLAATKNAYIPQYLKNEVNAYWKHNPKLVLFEKSGWRLLKKIIPKHPEQWFNNFYKKALKVYPYFWFHYLFGKSYFSDENFKNQWDQVIKISADIPHRLQFEGLTSPLRLSIKKEIDECHAPVYKLIWKTEISDGSNETILDYLLRSR